VVLCSVGFGAAAAFLATSRGSSESFTEFYILGPGGTSEGYPRTLELGDSLTVILGVVNHEGEDAGYRIEATVGEKAAGLTDSLRLEDGERWEGPMTLVPSQARNSQEVEFLLYRDGVDEAYRAVHLWVDVKGSAAEALVAEAPSQPTPRPTVTPRPAASPTPLPTPPPPVLTAGPGGLIYTVEPDDTLTSVGERFGVSPEAIAAANGMPEPGPILASEELIIPGTTYVVQAGDSLASIAAAFGVTPAAIMEANGIADASTIYAEREVAIPGVAP
jgi:LysM repeat protein